MIRSLILAAAVALLAGGCADFPTVEEYRAARVSIAKHKIDSTRAACRTAAGLPRNSSNWQRYNYRKCLSGI